MHNQCQCVDVPEVETEVATEEEDTVEEPTHLLTGLVDLWT